MTHFASSLTSHNSSLSSSSSNNNKNMAFQDSSFLLDSLYCHEPKLEDEQDQPSESSYESDLANNSNNNASLFPLLLLEQDLFWEDDDLISLFTKEQQQVQEASSSSFNLQFLDSSLSLARREAVEWILKVNAHHGFSALTSTLAINYLDRFILSFNIEIEKPWMIQLVAVTCLSLAAKVEETHLPPLLDLQVEDNTTKYVFDGKTILRMELLVLSTLKWKMHPVTPLSFLHHIIRRLGLKTHLHWQFLKHCEHLLLSALSASRFVGCLPSVLATATMLRVIEQIQHNDAAKYKKQLLGVLKMNKEKVEECYKAILEAADGKDKKKRKYGEKVMEGGFGSDEGSNGWWKVGSSSSLCCSPPAESLLKRNRHQQQQQRNNMKMSPLNRVGVAIVVSSP